MTTTTDDRPDLGPGSLTWEHFGDLRTLLLVGWAGALQVMHPTISQALVDHSDVFEDPLGRLRRSAGPVLDVVYGPDDAGRQVRHRHDDIGGTGTDGVAYHALQSDPFTWAHCTFVAMQYAVAERFGPPLDAQACEQLYSEAREWFARYGLSDRELPTSYGEFCEYWDRTVHDVLTCTEAARRLLVDRGPLPAPHPVVPAAAWHAVEPAVAETLLWLTRGLLPAEVRDKLGWQWSVLDEAALSLLAVVVRTGFHAVPGRWRLAPPARRAYRRSRRRFTG